MSFFETGQGLDNKESLAVHGFGVVLCSQCSFGSTVTCILFTVTTGIFTCSFGFDRSCTLSWFSSPRAPADGSAGFTAWRLWTCAVIRLPTGNFPFWSSGFPPGSVESFPGILSGAALSCGQCSLRWSGHTGQLFGDTSSVVIGCLCRPEGGSGWARFGFVAAVSVLVWLISAVQGWGSLSSCCCTSIVGHKEQQPLPVSSCPHPSTSHYSPLKISSCWATIVKQTIAPLCRDCEMLRFYHKKNWGLCRIAGRRRAD